MLSAKIHRPYINMAMDIIEDQYQRSRSIYAAVPPVFFFGIPRILYYPPGFSAVNIFNGKELLLCTVRHFDARDHRWPRQ
jgi:hypothetical protein